MFKRFCAIITACSLICICGCSDSSSDENNTSHTVSGIQESVHLEDTSSPADTHQPSNISHEECENGELAYEILYENSSSDQAMNKLVDYNDVTISNAEQYRLLLESFSGLEAHDDDTGKLTDDQIQSMLDSVDFHDQVVLFHTGHARDLVKQCAGNTVRVEHVFCPCAPQSDSYWFDFVILAVPRGEYTWDVTTRHVCQNSDPTADGYLPEDPSKSPEDWEVVLSRCLEE